MSISYADSETGGIRRAILFILRKSSFILALGIDKIPSGTQIYSEFVR